MAAKISRPRNRALSELLTAKRTNSGKHKNPADKRSVKGALNRELKKELDDVK